MVRALVIRGCFAVSLAFSSAGCVRTDGYVHFPFGHPSMTMDDVATPTERRVQHVIEGAAGDLR